ncbi:4Fe-4S binding protein [Photobacterium sp. DA100]|uniref:FMN-binding protein n=1 Tax=Photobacterium sp. DA100 TaxID=3027472 RepID=UPI002479AA75|nr:4Fe-4S binding protein [Photobacterium sp. DA100]WEM41326.1 4Fe-4S binding protein [Photobacterium sp. DA100]
MERKTKPRRNSRFDKFVSVISILALAFAWYLGGQRTNHSQTQFFDSILASGEQLIEVAPLLYQIVPSVENNPAPETTQDTSKWVSFGTGVGYGGELTIGAVFSHQGEIETIALLGSKETTSYFDKVAEQKLPESLLAQNIKTALSVDAVSGATLTSKAYTQALNQAADPIRLRLFGYQFTEAKPAWHYLKWLDAAALLFFVAAVWVSRTRSEHKSKMNAVLLAGSTLLFGFHSASLYSASTMAGLVSGTWLSGVANYTPFILLMLSIGCILYYNRNVYCQSLCPFGAVQQCLAKVGKAKASPIRRSLFIWFPRFLLLATLCLGAYFRNPAAFVYEPFGIAFGMIGGMYLFILTVMILLTSLIVRRPWCQSLCPINTLTDFVVFNKQWIKQAAKPRKRRQGMAKRTAPKQIAAEDVPTRHEHTGGHR